MYSNAIAQVFTMSNSSKTKEIKASDILRINIINNNAECSTYYTYYGALKDVSDDSIAIQAKYYRITTNFYNPNAVLEPNIEYNNHLVMINKKDISDVRKFKSLKDIKRKTNLSRLGGVLFISGGITALNALLFANGKSRTNLLIASGVQAVAGISLGIATHPKKHKFKKTDDPWKFD